MSPGPKPVCANPDHSRPAAAIARLSWPDARFKPTTACVGDMQWQVRTALDNGRAVLVEPAGRPEKPVVTAIKEVAKLHRSAYSEPVCAILLEAPDHPCYESLPETLEERRKLPARFHVPRWTETGIPQLWVCAVCWDEGSVTQWPCEAAREHGGEVFAR
ncbi:hypothetical protein HS041_22500 [Planomonospora sp. ID67723]|uniref:hypothetical protein n=1 Tax=Planomonospora sp. ID67723 TaxID=2738134 RepID=UPI0018C3CFC2|nr:hypothetical protein [Planomonospora sp. ID67723]MBG0830536.1 hypothetical protein [Planomonospora sp. ID67723]